MINRRLDLLRFTGIVVFLMACVGGPPNLQEALDLYREGHINESRRDLAAYIKAKPFNPESEDARQHILLIRRIKQLESIAITQWKRGNTEGAKKIIGIIRILHPVYVDSAKIYWLIDFSQPPAWASDPKIEIPPLPVGETDSSHRKIIPFAIRILNRQERAVICLSREWEERRLSPPDAKIESILSNPDVSQAILEIDSADRAMRQVALPSNPLVMEVNAISARFDDLVGYVSSESTEPSISFEYGFQSQKRELLTRILHLKSRLINL
jgi:hypothetical protein